MSWVNLIVLLEGARCFIFHLLHLKLKGLYVITVMVLIGLGSVEYEATRANGS